MLLGVDPLLNGELLKILDEMGHGDQLLVVDRNYPATSSGRPVVRLGDVTVSRAIEAILSVFPLDTFVDRPLERMESDTADVSNAGSQLEVLAVAQAAHGRSLEFAIVPRGDFYERAKSAFAVVHTLETRPYSCYILQKGVIEA